MLGLYVPTRTPWYPELRATAKRLCPALSPRDTNCSRAVYALMAVTSCRTLGSNVPYCLGAENLPRGKLNNSCRILSVDHGGIFRRPPRPPPARVFRRLRRCRSPPPAHDRRHAARRSELPIGRLSRRKRDPEPVTNQF